MAAGTLKSYNTFVKGIITEAGPLTYPENASIDEENCVLNRDGSRQRRLGMDFEEDFVLRGATVESDDAVASFRWYNADNAVANQFAVVQAGQQLFIFDANEVSISAHLLDTIDLSSRITGKTSLSVSSGMGFLICAEETAEPFYIKYDAGVFTVHDIAIKIRDFYGVDDSLDVDENPVTLSAAHNYNLRNQGWSAANITAYFGSQASYPSNAQQWFVGKDTNEDFSAAQLVKMDFGTTPAPKGRFVIDAFDREATREAASGVSGLAADQELGRPSAVGWAFERVFFAGIESRGTFNDHSPNMTGCVFYSRTVRAPKDFGQMHSDADPTSEIDSELVDTDGGLLNIPDSGKIHKLLPKGNGMLVFAEQGIWGIFGGDSGFRATDYQVVKLSDFGVISPTTTVDAEDNAFYWNRGGIYVLAPDPNSGRMSSQNITENSIQTLYNEIDQVSKETAVGTYDPINRRISWMYNDQEGYTGETFRNRYNKELVLDMVLTAYYKNSISSHEEPSPYIAGYIDTPDFLLRKEGVRGRGDSVTKYLVVQFIDPPTNSASVSFAYYRDESLRDWRGSDGVGTSYESFLVTGYETMGDTVRNKNAARLFVHCKRTETLSVLNEETEELEPDNPSGLLIQTRWDWSDSATSGKWSEPFQAYRLTRPMFLPAAGQPIDYGAEVVTSNNRIPGRGRALSMYMTSDGDKDFYVYGWAIKFTGVTSV